jgi:hypothetical protein
VSRHDREPDDPVDAEDEDSLIDTMRGSGVGVEDPTIVGDPEPGIVEEQVSDEDPPKV